MPKACPYVIAFSFMVNSVDYRKNTERNTTKIPNETPQKYRMKYHKNTEWITMMYWKPTLCFF